MDNVRRWWSRRRSRGMGYSPDRPIRRNDIEFDRLRSRNRFFFSLRSTRPSDENINDFSSPTFRKNSKSTHPLPSSSRATDRFQSSSLPSSILQPPNSSPNSIRPSTNWQLVLPSDFFPSPPPPFHGRPPPDRLARPGIKSPSLEGRPSRRGNLPASNMLSRTRRITTIFVTSSSHSSRGDQRVRYWLRCRCC